MTRKAASSFQLYSGSPRNRKAAMMMPRMAMPPERISSSCLPCSPTAADGMAGSTSAETHFRLVIVSNEFEGSRQIQRHRMVNQLLKEELAREGGIHALQVKALTPEEEEKKSAQE